MNDVSVTGSNLTLEGHARDGGLIARLTGELDLAGAEVMDNLTKWVGAHPTEAPLVLDLSSMTFVDSSGLRMLLQASDGGRTVALFSPSAPVARVLELTGIREKFVEISSMDSATIDGLRSGPGE
jgi:anti-sigma B factor antagonist